MPNAIGVLRRRLTGYAARWDAATLRGLEPYLGKPVNAHRLRRDGDRYWTLFPRAIWDAWAPAHAKRESGFVDDLLWGQYCVFLFVRIHDDLLDGQAAHRNLIFVADDLLLESQRAFAARLNTGAFRALFERYVRETLRAIVRVDALQARPGVMTRARLGLHARVSSIFNLGAAAACLACDRPAMIPRFEKACANLAVASQLLDDLTDVEEDLARGRYNFVTNVLGGGGVLDGATRAGRVRIARAVIQEDRLDEVLALVRLHGERAAAALAPARIPAIEAYVRMYLVAVERMRRTVHQARVAFVFSGMVSDQRQALGR